MTLDWRLPDESTYLALNERLIVSARLHPLMAMVPFIRVTALAFIALYALAFLGWLGALVVLGIVVQWIRKREVLGKVSFFPAFGATLILLYASGFVTNLSSFVLLLMIGGLLVAAYQLIDYFYTKVSLTDRRIVRVSGILTRTVATMPLKSLTDIRYDQTVFGRILNYGHFSVESAGQDQALSVIRFVSQPRRFYRIVMQEALVDGPAPDHYLGSTPPNGGTR